MRQAGALGPHIHQEGLAQSGSHTGRGPRAQRVINGCVRYRGKLGVRRTARHIVDDVDVSAIGRLPQPYESLGPDKFQIGGAAPKSLVVVASADTERHAYIAKCPGKHGAREAVTEYLISCVARGLPLRVARGRLVRMPPPPSVKCDVRFLSRYFLSKKNQSLIHGVEIIARTFEMDAAELRSEVPKARASDRQFFTVDLISGVLDSVGKDDDQRLALRADFARMMAFDALIGANDRHPENWGLVYDALHPEDFVFAPIYDTARGLFWNWSDERLAAEDRRGRQAAIQRYAHHSKPLISRFGPSSRRSRRIAARGCYIRGSAGCSRDSGWSTSTPSCASVTRGSRQAVDCRKEVYAQPPSILG
jgi:hypothetical protein